MSNGKSDMVEVGPLWERESAKGNEYLGGTVGDEDITIPAGAFLMVFPNNSDNPKAPSFRVMYSPPRDGAPQRQQPKGAFNKFKSQGQKPAETSADDDNDF